MRALIFALFLCWLAGAHAEDTATTDRRVKLRTIEPARDVGYTVGDKLSRTVILEVERPYVLLPTSLPLADTQKKRRNQGQGIEVRAATLEHTSRGNQTVYTLHLTYQVFTNKNVAKPAALPAETIKFGHRGENFEVRIPSWSFRISPLAVFGAVDVEKDMSPLRGPLLRDATPHRTLLWVLLTIGAAALLGLIYILGNTAWFPRMGGPFALAYRDIRRAPKTREGLASAVSRLHRALNTTAGTSIFDSAEFLEGQPRFAPLGQDLERFFGLSRSVFFEPSLAHGVTDPDAWLKQFSRRCRDIERGLR